MSHSYQIPYVRHSLRGASDLMSVTAMASALAQASARMAESPWTRLEEQSSDLPLHRYDHAGFADTYDAATFCGDYDAGRQRAYACAACYTIRIPAEARAGTAATLEGIAATVIGDRWTSAGAVVAAIPSSSPSPPSWAAVLAAAYSSPDPVTAEDDVDPTWQPPLRKITRSNDGVDSSHSADIAVYEASPEYLHVVIRMGDYLSHAGAWVEGGAAVVGDSLQVAFDRVVVLDAVDVGLRLPLRIVANASVVEFLGSNANLADPYLRLSWGLRMLVGGRVAESASDPNTWASISTTLSPQVYLDGVDVHSRGAVIECFCARSSLAGYSLFLHVTDDVVGISPVRISIVDSAAAPDLAAPGTWNGAGSSVIGSVLVRGAEAGDTITVPITRDAASARLWIVAAFEDVDIADAAEAFLGWDDYTGISLADAHVAESPLSIVHAPPTSGLMSFTDPGSPLGMIFPLLRNLSVPSGEEGWYYAINADGSACRSGTTYGPWLDWTAGTPVPSLGSNSYLTAGIGFFLANDNGVLRYSGDISALDATINPAIPTASFIAAAYDGLVVTNSSGTVSVLGTAAQASLSSTIGTWTNMARVIVAGGGGAFGVFRAIGHTNGLTLQTHGFDAGSKSALEALTGVSWVAMGGSIVAIAKTDGTAVVYKGAFPTFHVLSAVAQSWANVQAISASSGVAWAVLGAAAPYSVALLTVDGSTSISWFDAADLPSGTSPAFVVGSHYQRAAVAYYTP